MTAPRAREQADPPSPPDRLPPRRGGHPSSKIVSPAARPAGFARLAGARHGLVRSARALAAAALLALCGGLALPATAQAAELVSNFDEVGNTSNSFRNLEFGMGFTTGQSSSSFPLTSIEVKLIGDPTGVTATATVRRASSGNPGAVHATLIAPTPLVVGNNTCTAPAGTTLAAERSYFLVLQSDATSGLFLAGTTSDDQDAAPGSGWEIADGYRSRNPDAVVPTWASHSSAIKIRVNGTDTGPLTPTAFDVRGDGNKLWIRFNQNLSNKFPPTSAFTLTAAGSPVTIGSISLNGIDTLTAAFGTIGS